MDVGFIDMRSHAKAIGKGGKGMSRLAFRFDASVTDSIDGIDKSPFDDFLSFIIGISDHTVSKTADDRNDIHVYRMA